MQRVEKKKDWKPTPEAFRRFLDWLDEGVPSEGQKYLEMRQRLVAVFDRKNCLTPDELADETLNRVTRRLEEEGSIETESPAKYCYIVARFVFHEYLRSASNKFLPIEEIPPKSASRNLVAGDSREEAETREKRLDCLENCANKLESENRQLIISYYRGEEGEKIRNRKTLAENLGVTLNALSIRACRIRDKLEGCVKKCVDGE